MTVEFASLVAPTTRTGYYEICGRTFVDCDNAEVSTAGTYCLATLHLVDTVLARIDGAGESTAASVRTLNTNTPIRHVVTERCHWFEVDRIPTKLDESLS